MSVTSPWQQDFPVFLAHPELAYLDCAATSLTPKCVADAVHYYQCFSHANSHKGLYQLSANATQLVEQGREKVADFIHADDGSDIVFTASTTEAINLVAQGLVKRTIQQRIKCLGQANIVISIAEHHANFLPWQQLSQQTGAELRVATLNEIGKVDLASVNTLIDDATVLVAFHHISNVLGVIQPIAEICTLAHKKNALVLVDGAQAVAHVTVDVTKLKCDFYTFSAHKMYGISGCGILYGKQHLLQQITPLLLGGGIVEQVSQQGYTLVNNAMKLEAGSYNVASIVGLTAAIDYIQRFDALKRQQYMQELLAYLQQCFASLDFIRPLLKNKTKLNNNIIGVVSFNVQGVHSHDVASFLDSVNIAVRAGHHCAQPLHQLFGVKSSVRISLGIHNSKADIDKLVLALNNVYQLLA